MRLLQSSVPTAVERQPHRDVPSAFTLLPNYPNPFNPATTLGFQIAEVGFTTLKVYDLLGREVAALVQEELRPGHYRVRWDASGLPSGVYVSRLESRGSMSIKRMILVK